MEVFHLDIISLWLSFVLFGPRWIPPFLYCMNKGSHNNHSTKQAYRGHTNYIPGTISASTRSIIWIDVYRVLFGILPS